MERQEIFTHIAVSHFVCENFGGAIESAGDLTGNVSTSLFGGYGENLVIVFVLPE